MPLVLITGSSSGIGKATAKLFQQKGWQVVATMRNPEKEQELTTLENIEVMKLDVTNSTQIHEVVQKIIAQYGHIDAVVNNAGYGLIGPVETATTEQIQQQYATNVLGLITMCQAVSPHMRTREAGTIINVSSMGGRISLPFYTLYMSTKWAVEGFSESLQYELSPFKIKVKLIEPGAIETDFFNRSLVVTDIETIPAYKKLFNKANANMDKWSGSKPELVAQTIYRAATDQNNKLRYPVGRDAKVLTFFKKILPDRVWGGLVKRILD